MKRSNEDATRTFSALDALWILLAAIALILLLVSLIPLRAEGAEEREVRYVLRVRDVDPAMLGDSPEWIIPVGAPVKNENGTAALGEVESVTLSTQRRATVKDGVVVLAEEADRMILEITVRGTARVKRGDGVRISDVRIAAGSVGGFRLGGYYAARAWVILVEEI